MKEDLHKDGLEDFLRKSFEQYDDSPSDGLWDRIDADLSVQPKVVPLKLFRYWWAVAAAAMLVGMFSVQYFCFQQEKKELVEIINSQNKRIELLEKKLQQQKEENFTAIEKKEGKINSKNENEKSTDGLSQAPVTDFGVVEKEKINKIKAINEGEKNTANLIVEKSPLVTEVEEGWDLFENKISSTIAESRKELNFPNTINTLGLIKLKNTEQPFRNFHLPLATIDPVNKKGHFSIGANASYFSTEEKIARAIQRPMGGGPFQRVFNAKSAFTGATSMVGLTTYYHAGNNWMFGAGVQMRHASLSMKHLVSLRFMDRWQGGGSNSDHVFAYSLNTAAGLVDVEVGADQSDPGGTINELEKVDIAINAEQVVDYVSIPLKVGRQFGKGRISGTVQSGLLLNFLTEQSFTISGKITNDKFRNDKTRFARRDGQGLKKTTVDFTASAGVNYFLNNYWQLNISPTIILPTANRHNDPYIKSSGISAGIELGVHCFF